MKKTTFSFKKYLKIINPLCNFFFFQSSTEVFGKKKSNNPKEGSECSSEVEEEGERESMSVEGLSVVETFSSLPTQHAQR